MKTIMKSWRRLAALAYFEPEPGLSYHSFCCLSTFETIVVLFLVRSVTRRRILHKKINLLSLRTGRRLTKLFAFFDNIDVQCKNINDSKTRSAFVDMQVI